MTDIGSSIFLNDPYSLLRPILWHWQSCIDITTSTTLCDNANTDSITLDSCSTESGSVDVQGLFLKLTNDMTAKQ